MTNYNCNFIFRLTRRTLPSASTWSTIPTWPSPRASSWWWGSTTRMFWWVPPTHPSTQCHRSNFWNLNCELDPIFLIEIVFLQTRSEARGLVVQTIQYYGWAGFDDKKFGHLFRSCSVLSESLTHNVLTQVHLRNWGLQPSGPHPGDRTRPGLPSSASLITLHCSRQNKSLNILFGF